MANYIRYYGRGEGLKPEKVFVDISAVCIPEARRAMALTSLFERLPELVGEILKVRVENVHRTWTNESIQVLAPGWLADREAGYLAVHGSYGTMVLRHSPWGFRFLFRRLGLGFPEALASAPAHLEKCLELIESTMAPDCVGPILGVRATTEHFVLPLPPCNDHYFYPGFTYWKVDGRCPSVLPAESVSHQRFECLFDLALPPGVRRRHDGPYVTFDWALPEGCDEQEYGVQRGLQYQWYRDAMALPIDPNYNEQGDYRRGGCPKSSDPLLSFHEPDAGLGARGVKAMVPDGGRLDTEVLRDLERALARGATPSGTPVDLVWLIVPTREEALAVLPQARQHGLGPVLYVDRRNALMDPEPAREGGWLHQVAPGRGYRGVRRA